MSTQNVDHEINLTLNNFELFKDCPSELYSNLLDKFEWREYQRREFIFREGNRVKGIYCVFKGSVKIFKKTHSGITNIISIALPGDVIGLKSAMSQKKQEAAAIALEPALIAQMTTEHLFSHISDCPDTRLKIMSLLCRASDEMEQRILGFIQKSVSTRLAETLLILQENFGTDEQNYLKTTLNFSEIATLVHTSRFTLYRIFNRWRQQGIIQTSGHKIQITNMAELTRIGNWSD